MISKYRNKIVIIDGIRFDSMLEGERYKTLRIAERGGAISDLKLQVPFELKVNGLLICKYIADFTYIQNGKLVVNDAKGVQTKEFKLKQKLMLAVHGIEIQLSKRSK